MASSASASAAPDSGGGRDKFHQFGICPITHEVMKEPYMFADGFTYEHKAIKEWVDAHGTSPMTNIRFANPWLRPNRALKDAIEAISTMSELHSEKLSALRRSNDDKDACLFALEADLQQAEAKQGNCVSLVEHERLLTEVKHLRRRLQFAEESQREDLPTKRRRLAADHAAEAEPPPAENTTEPVPAAELGGSSPAGELQQNYQSDVADLLDATQQQLAKRLQSIEGELSFVRTSYRDELKEAERLAKIVNEQDAEVEEDEAKVAAARVNLSALFAQREAKLKERDAMGKLITEQAEAMGFPKLADTLTKIMEAPQEYSAGHAGEYARLHVELQILQQQHRQEMARIGILEEAANASRKVAEERKAKWTASLCQTCDLKKELDAVEQAKAKLELEQSSTEARRERFLKSLDTFGSEDAHPAVWAAVPNNIMMLSMLDCIVTKRLAGLQSHMQEQIDGLKQDVEHVHRDLAKHIPTISRTEMAQTNSAEQSMSMMSDMVRLCKPVASHMLKHGYSIKDLQRFGYSYEEMVESACEPFPRSLNSMREIVTHVFMTPEIQSSRLQGTHPTIISPLLTFSSGQSADWRYSFELMLCPNGSSCNHAGSIGLFFRLRPGLNPKSLAWPMPIANFSLKLRVLATAGLGLRHKQHVLDGKKDSDVAEYFAERRHPETIQELREACLGVGDLVAADTASSGAYFLGHNKEAVAVQCELCLR